MPLIVRLDLLAAHDGSLAHIASPGPNLTGAQRVRIATIARDAYLASDPSPPWHQPFDDDAGNLAYRLARHAGTLTREWFDGIVSKGMDPLLWIEVVGVVVAMVPVVAFRRAIGTSVVDLPAGSPGPPAGRIARHLVDAELNWVPVAAPADQSAAVVQALSALPDEWDNTWRLAAAQYMSDRQMDDPGWTRGTLSRAQMELVAARLSRLRECFY